LVLSPGPSVTHGPGVSRSFHSDWADQMNRQNIAAVVALELMLTLMEGRAIADSPVTFKMTSVRLYQPQDVVGARVTVEDLAVAAKEVEAAFAAATAGDWYPKIEGVLVAVAVRPGRAQHVWCDFIGNIAPRDAARLEAALAKTRAPATKGLIAYALNFARAGHKVVLPEIPKSWQEVAKKAGRPILIPDGVVAALWPEAAQHGVAPLVGSASKKNGD